MKTVIWLSGIWLLFHAHSFGADDLCPKNWMILHSDEDYVPYSKVPDDEREAMEDVVSTSNFREIEIVLRWPRIHAEAFLRMCLYSNDVSSEAKLYIGGLLRRFPRLEEDYLRILKANRVREGDIVDRASVIGALGAMRTRRALTILGDLLFDERPCEDRPPQGNVVQGACYFNNAFLAASDFAYYVSNGPPDAPEANSSGHREIAESHVPMYQKWWLEVKDKPDSYFQFFDDIPLASATDPTFPGPTAKSPPQHGERIREKPDSWRWWLLGLALPAMAGALWWLLRRGKETEGIG